MAWSLARELATFSALQHLDAAPACIRERGLPWAIKNLIAQAHGSRGAGAGERRKGARERKGGRERAGEKGRERKRKQEQSEREKAGAKQEHAESWVVNSSACRAALSSQVRARLIEAGRACARPQALVASPR